MKSNKGSRNEKKNGDIKIHKQNNNLDATSKIANRVPIGTYITKLYFMRTRIITSIIGPTKPRIIKGLTSIV